MALTDNIVAAWKLDESSGTSCADATGNGNTGTATGTTAGVTGKLSLGRQFANNTSDKVTITHTSSLMSATFSISVWVYITSNSAQYVRVLEKGGASSDGGYGLEWNAADAANKLKFVIWNSTNAQGTATTTSLSLNTWYHVVCTFDGSTAKIYLNGSLETSNGGQTMTTNTSNLLLGKYAPDTTHTFTGTIDDVNYWSRELSSTEVSSLYNGGTGLAYPFSSSVSDTITVGAAHVYTRPQTVNVPGAATVATAAAHVYARPQTINVTLAATTAVSSAHAYARPQSVSPLLLGLVSVSNANVFTRPQAILIKGSALITVDAAHVYVRGQTVGISSTTGTTITVDAAHVYVRGQSVGVTLQASTQVNAAHAYARPQAVGVFLAASVTVGAAHVYTRPQSGLVKLGGLISVDFAHVYARGQSIVITDTLPTVSLVAPLGVEVRSPFYTIACTSPTRDVTCEHLQYKVTAN